MAGKITPDVAEAVLAELSLGELSLRQICVAKGFTASAFIQKVNADEELAKHYTRAREIGDDAAFDRLREQMQEQPQTVKGFVDSGWVAWKRHVVDTLKWELSKRQPKKYGDKMQHTGEDGGPMQFVVTRAGKKEN